jgi:hypothetical protein
VYQLVAPLRSHPPIWPSPAPTRRLGQSQLGAVPVADQLDRLKAALSDRYRIERELGSGGMVTVYLPKTPSITVNVLANLAPLQRG